MQIGGMVVQSFTRSDCKGGKYNARHLRNTIHTSDLDLMILMSDDDGDDYDGDDYNEGRRIWSFLALQDAPEMMLLSVNRSDFIQYVSQSLSSEDTY